MLRLPLLKTENPKGLAPGPTAWVLLVLGYVVAAAMFALRVLGSDMPFYLSLAGATAFTAVLSIPPTLALFAMRGRPNLFAAAGVLSITLALGVSVLGSRGGSVSGPDVVMSSCVSDIVTWAEAAVSLTLVAAALGSGRAIAGASRPATKISTSPEAV